MTNMAAEGMHRKSPNNYVGRGGSAALAQEEDLGADRLALLGWVSDEGESDVEQGTWRR